MNPLQRIAAGLREILIRKREEEPDVRLRVVNLTRGTVIATSLETAASPEKRRKGLLGREGFAAGEGLWIIPCESVHTFFMRFPIDLVYLDRANRVRKLRSSVGAWRLSACFSAHSVVELPAGTIRASETRKGDALDFVPAGDEGA